MSSCFVLDASVIVKWFFSKNSRDSHTNQALYLLKAFQLGEVKFLQPPHWLAEVAGVVSRIAPKIADRVISDLFLLQIPESDALEVYRLACSLSSKLDHHLFDTLYHAVALYHKKSVLLTADEKYFKKANALGNIRLLSSVKIKNA